VFQSVVESKVQQNQPPPTDIPKQIDYYKDIVRMVYRIALPTPGSNSGSGFESSQPVDGRSVSTPAYSTANTVPNLRQGVSLNRAHELATSTMPPGGSPLLQSFSSTFSASPSGPSLRSPCSTEARSASEESTVITRSGQLQKPSGSDAAIISPSPRRPLDFQARAQPMSQNSSSVPSQSGTTMPIHSGINAGTIMPPPLRRGLTPGISTQNTKQHSMQHFQDRPLHFSLDDMAPCFDSNDSTTLFNFTSMPEDQESQGWPDMQMPHGQEMICQFCMNSGYISIPSGTQPCPACDLSYAMRC
jgi:hypothetical protein